MIRIPVVVAWAGLMVACALLAGSPLRAVAAKRVSGNLVFWDQARGFDSIVANADVFSEISPFWFRVLADGRVVPYTTASGASYEDPAILAFLRSRGILVIPTVANIINGVWDGALVSRIIADPQLRAVNLDALVNLAAAGGTTASIWTTRTSAPRTARRFPRSFSSSPERCMRRASCSR